MSTSPAWNYISPLWSVRQFAIETDNGWGRSQLRRIDRQLGIAKAAEANTAQYVRELARLIDECRAWMIAKEQKFARKAKTRSYEKRLKAITTLMNQALLHLKFIAFEDRKAIGARGGLVGLKPGYDRERMEFEDMKNNVDANHGLRLDPHSPSFVTAGLGQYLRPNARWYQEIDWLLAKDVDTMTDEEFLYLSRLLRQDWGVELSNGGLLPRVHYVRKEERINNNMLIPLAGRLFKDSGRHPYTSSGRNGKDIYAIDKYGNLMSIADDAQFDDGTFKSEHRHSSLNAGNRVICAGYISIQQGMVTYIDNKSGHYKPTERDLASAVLVLMNEHDLDLKITRIVGYIPTGPNSVVKHTDIVGGVQFTNLVVPPPPYPPPF